jgi:hypothetical protein
MAQLLVVGDSICTGLLLKLKYFSYRLSCVAVGDDCNDGEGKVGVSDSGVADLFFIGATLHLRGAKLVSQPLVAPTGSVLVYNGNALELDVKLLLFISFTNYCPPVIYADQINEIISYR